MFSRRIVFLRHHRHFGIGEISFEFFQIVHGHRRDVEMHSERGVGLDVPSQYRYLEIRRVFSEFRVSSGIDVIAEFTYIGDLAAAADSGGDLRKLKIRLVRR